MAIVMISVLVFLFVFFVYIFTSLIMPKPGIHSDDPAKKKESLSNLFHMLIKKFLIMHTPPAILVIFSFLSFIYYGEIPDYCKDVRFLFSLLICASNAFFLAAHGYCTYNVDTKKTVFAIYETDDAGNVYLEPFTKKLIFIGTLVIFCIHTLDTIL